MLNLVKIEPNLMLPCAFLIISIKIVFARIIVTIHKLNSQSCDIIKPTSKFECKLAGNIGKCGTLCPVHREILSYSGVASPTI